MSRVSLTIDNDVLEWEIFQDSDMFRVFMFLVLSASKRNVTSDGMELPKGETLCSISTLCQRLNLSTKRARTLVRKLQEMGAIRVTKRANKRANVTITDIVSYTDEGQTLGHEMGKQTELKKANKNADEQPKEIYDPKIPIEWDAFHDYFNRAMDGKTIPPLRKLTDNRKQHILARAREFGKESLQVVIDNAAASSFLNGGNGKGWFATFDWIFTHPLNYAKVLDGNYNVQAQGVVLENLADIPLHDRKYLTNYERQKLDEQQHKQMCAELFVKVGQMDEITAPKPLTD